MIGRPPDPPPGPHAEDARPPAVPTRLLSSDTRDHVLGDLIEEYRRRYVSVTPAAARNWYWSQIARSVVPLGWHRVNALPTAQTLVSVALAFTAIWVWTWTLNQNAVRAVLFRLAGTPLSFALVGLEFSTFLLAGLVVGHVARSKPRTGVVLTGVVVLAWPMLYEVLKGGTIGPMPGIWGAIVGLGGIQLGAWASRIWRRT